MFLLLSGLRKRYKTNFDALRLEIELYENEKEIWITKGDINNSAGNLALHIIGNLNHFIGAKLGRTGYERDRESEFTSRNVDRKTLIKEMETTAAMVDKVLLDFEEEDLNKNFPIEIGKEQLNNGQLFIFLLSHFSYHLGQINYHRRMV